MSTVNTAAQGEERVRPRIGKYQIKGRIGKGGMGQVYRGYDEALDREVAVKTLNIQGSLEEESRKRFEIEARAAARLQHPNIVTVFELGSDRGMPFIAMELLPGWDLEGLMRSGETLLLPEKLDIIIQVCRGLQYAHEHHIVHRDIKPSNIRLLDDGVVKIMDFGIAKLANTHVTRTGMMVGTVHYMCPEAIQGQGVDGRSDVFAVGVILYELLAGKRPFEGEGATEVLFKIVQEPTPVLPDVGLLQPALQKIVNRALAKVPAERYASAARFADDLAELRSRLEKTVAPAPEEQDTIQAARQLVKQGQLDEGMTRLREVIERTPGSIEARRVLRAAAREAARRSKPAEPEADFPELTFQMTPTQLVPTTMVPAQASIATGSQRRAETAAMGKTLLAAGSAVLVVAVIAGALLLRKSAKPEGPGGVATDGLGNPLGQVTAAPDTPGQPTGGPAPPKALALRLISEPTGAAVVLDGDAVSGKTPVSITIDPARPHQLSFSLDGYATKKVTVAAGTTTPDLRVVLATLGPPGKVFVASGYPVDVSEGGRSLVKGETSPTLSLSPGRHTLSITSSSVFLRATREIEVASGGSARIEVAGLGELNVQANPDNCRIFVDGVFVDYPPILKKSVAAGHHTVSFKWADGPQKEESIDVEAGRPVYVTGRQD